MKFNKNLSVYTIGDVHNAIEMAVNNMQKFWNVKNSVIIFVGDVNLGFQEDKKLKHRLEFINKGLKKYNNTIILMRGNHDKPEIFNKRWKEFSFSNIKVIKDYTTLSIGDKKILCVGGAISIDRKLLVKGKTWWDDECFVYYEDKLKNINHITHVVTHNAPNFCQPIGFSPLVYHYAKNDKTLLDELLQERQLHTDLYNDLIKKGCVLKEWHYGHFHFANNEIIEGTKFVLNPIGSISKIS